jgi:hypothetical protein
MTHLILYDASPELHKPLSTVMEVHHLIEAVQDSHTETPSALGSCQNGICKIN